MTRLGRVTDIIWLSPFACRLVFLTTSHFTTSEQASRISLDDVLYLTDHGKFLKEV